MDIIPTTDRDDSLYDPVLDIRVSRRTVLLAGSSLGLLLLAERLIGNRPEKDTGGEMVVDGPTFVNTYIGELHEFQSTRTRDPYTGVTTPYGAQLYFSAYAGLVGAIDLKDGSYEINNPTFDMEGYYKGFNYNPDSKALDMSASRLGWGIYKNGDNLSVLIQQPVSITGLSVGVANYQIWTSTDGGMTFEFENGLSDDQAIVLLSPKE